MCVRDAVPGPGIEPWRRGSSGLADAWPGPRDPLEKLQAEAATGAAWCQADAGSGQLALPFDAETSRWLPRALVALGSWGEHGLRWNRFFHGVKHLQAVDE